MKGVLSGRAQPGPLQADPLAGLYGILQAFRPDADLRLIRRAYDVAAAWHDGQTRFSGDPYITHPLAVATILAGLGASDQALCAALLHDTTAYTTCTFAELNREFGTEITDLVAGIAALDQIKYQGSSTAAQALAAAKAADRQVLAIKVADRLHNMRTVEFLPLDKQLRKAIEARDVFVPDARLLRLGTVESELEGESLITADHARYLTKQARQRFSEGFQAKLTELSACSTAELFTRAHDADASTRAAAVTLLQRRNEPTTPGPFLEALGTETHFEVRDALLRSLRPLANQPGFMSAWSSRLTDPGWLQVATLDPALSTHLPTLGAERLGRDVSLDPAIRADLVGQGVSVHDRASVTAQPGYWDLIPGSWGGRRYENGHSWLRIVLVQGQLRVQDLGKTARLVMAGAPLGDRAVPILRQVLRADPPSPLLQEAIPESLAATDGLAAVHELCAMLPTTEKDQPTGPPDSALLEAIAGIRSPHATEELIGTLRILTPARLRHYQDSERPPEAAPDPDLTRLNKAADALITALLAIGAQTQLAELAQEAFANGEDALRHVATMTAARLDVLAPRLDELLIRAVRGTITATRLVAVQALGQHETPSRRAALVDACLNDQDEKVRTAAATAIRGYPGDDGIHDLITHLAQDEPVVRARAADALGQIGDELAVTPLTEALNDELPLLQVSAARALRLLEPPRAGRVIDPLVTIAATDPDAEMRSLAVKELDQIPGGIDRLFVPFDDAFDAGRYEDALRALDGMAESFTDQTRLHGPRARTLRYLQRLPEALEEIEAVLYDSPDWAAALNLRTDLLFGLDRGDEGLAAIKEVAGRRPDDADLQASLGWWSYVSGQHDESIQASQHAIELNPDNVEARLNLGLALLAKGDDAVAERTYQQAIERANLGDRATAVTQLTTAIEELSELEQQTGVQKAIISAIRSLLQAGVDNLNAIQQGSAAGNATGD